MPPAHQDLRAGLTRCPIPCSLAVLALPPIPFPPPTTRPARPPAATPTQAAAEVQNLCQTLPQLLHHREAVARILMGALEPAARLSLPALLALTAALARDLQQEFLPLLPRLVRRLVALLDGGAEREPEVRGPGDRGG